MMIFICEFSLSKGAGKGADERASEGGYWQRGREGAPRDPGVYCNSKGFRFPGG